MSFEIIFATHNPRPTNKLVLGCRSKTAPPYLLNKNRYFTLSKQLCRINDSIVKAIFS